MTFQHKLIDATTPNPTDPIDHRSISTSRDNRCFLVWENSYLNQEEAQILHEPQACVIAAVAEAALQGLHHHAEVVPEEQLRSLMASTTPNLPNTPDPRRDARIKNPRKGRRRVPMRRRPPPRASAGGG